MTIESRKKKMISAAVRLLVKFDPEEFESDDNNGGETRAQALAEDLIDGLIEEGIIK